MVGDAGPRYAPEGAYHAGLIGQYIAMIRLASESDIVLGVTGG